MSQQIESHFCYIQSPELIFRAKRKEKYMTEKERKIKETMNQYLMYGCKKTTLSMVLPPYCYTCLCPNPTKRTSGLIWKGKHNDYGIGYRY